MIRNASARENGIAALVRRFDWRLALMIALAVNVGISLFVPIYIDEFVYKLSSARTFLERGAQISLYPQCPDTFVTRVPLPLLPGGALVALVWQTLTLFEMRLVGVLMFGSWLVLLHLLIRRLIPPAHSRLGLTFGAALLLSLGLTGFAMTLSRPEIFLILGLLAMVLLSLSAPDIIDAASNDRTRWARVAGTAALYLLIVSTLAFIHPNIVYFTPFVLFSIGLAFQRTSRVVMLAVAAAAAWAIVVGVMHSTRVIATCNDPAFRGMMGMYLNDIGALRTAPFETIKAMLWSLTTGLRQVVHYAAHGKEYQSSWLPATPVLASFPFAVALRWGLELIWHVLVLAGIVGLFLRLRDWRSPATRTALLLAAGLLLGFCGLFAHAKQLNFTIVELALPMLLVFALLTLAPWLPRLTEGTWARPVASTLGALMLTTVALNLVFIAPQLVGPAFSATFFNDKQHHSYGAWNQQARDDATRRLARQCNIIPGRAPNLVIDDVSYSIFRQDRRPMFAMYINPGHMGVSLGGRLKTFLAERQSSGFVGKCNYLAQELHGIAIRDGDACCVSAGALQAIR